MALTKTIPSKSIYNLANAVNIGTLTPRVGNTFTATNVTMTQIKTALSSSLQSLGGLATLPSINPYALFRPYSTPPWSMGDFVGYNPNAIPPTSFTTQWTNTNLTKQWDYAQGKHYFDITVTVRKGERPPTFQGSREYDQTLWEKFNIRVRITKSGSGEIITAVSSLYDLVNEYTVVTTRVYDTTAGAWTGTMEILPEYNYWSAVETPPHNVLIVSMAEFKLEYSALVGQIKISGAPQTISNMWIIGYTSVTPGSPLSSPVQYSYSSQYPQKILFEPFNNEVTPIGANNLVMLVYQNSTNPQGIYFSSLPIPTGCTGIYGVYLQTGANSFYRVGVNQSYTTGQTLAISGFKVGSSIAIIGEGVSLSFHSVLPTQFGQ